MNDQDGGSPPEESKKAKDQDQTQWNNLAELLGAEPTAESPAPKAKSEKPAPRRSGKGSLTPKATNWGALAGDLGLDAEPDPEPEVATTPESETTPNPLEQAPAPSDASPSTKTTARPSMFDDVVVEESNETAPAAREESSVKSTIDDPEFDPLSSPSAFGAPAPKPKRRERTERKSKPSKPMPSSETPASRPEAAKQVAEKFEPVVSADPQEDPLSRKLAFGPPKAQPSVTDNMFSTDSSVAANIPIMNDDGKDDDDGGEAASGFGGDSSEEDTRSEGGRGRSEGGRGRSGSGRGRSEGNDTADKEIADQDEVVVSGGADNSSSPSEDGDDSGSERRPRGRRGRGRGRGRGRRGRGEQRGGEDRDEQFAFDERDDYSESDDDSPKQVQSQEATAADEPAESDSDDDAGQHRNRNRQGRARRRGNRGGRDVTKARGGDDDSRLDESGAKLEGGDEARSSGSRSRRGSSGGDDSRSQSSRSARGGKSGSRKPRSERQPEGAEKKDTKRDEPPVKADGPVVSAESTESSAANDPAPRKSSFWNPFAFFSDNKKAADSEAKSPVAPAKPLPPTRSTFSAPAFGEPDLSAHREAAAASPTSDVSESDQGDRPLRSESDDEERPRRRRRRRGGRRGRKDSDSNERTNAESRGFPESDDLDEDDARLDSSTDMYDSQETDEDGDDQFDDGGGYDRSDNRDGSDGSESRSKRVEVPAWKETVGVMVDANLSRRGSGGGSDSGQKRRRGSRGRRRPRDRSND